ncbi:MAG: B12-binding domain-containing radical SAM protein [Verrucomicrobiales bacterium]|nr:B12-binding domain-containing radical SAM protein [Verrucomicrobiales bacterium]
MKRLLLISPLAANSLMGGDFFFRMPNLGLLRVAALTPQGWEVSIVDEKVETLNLQQDVDLVGITSMTPTAPRAYQLADHFRSRGAKVVLGGMHASKMVEEALGHADAVLVGEAEGLWPRLVADFEQGQLAPVYQHQGPLPDLGAMPAPDWNRYRDKRYLPVHFVETTRGCPIDCDFCSVTSAFGGRYRNRPLEDVLTELRGLKPFDGLLTLKNCVFFVDDNIVANRAYAREFLTRIADLGLKWFGQASMNITRDDEILRLCQRSGCVGLFVGFESLSEETLRSVGKRVNHPERYLEVVQKLHDHGIGVDASFVFGFDTDGPDVFDRTLEFSLKAKLDIAYFSILTPYPGTRLHAQFKAENRLLSEDWSLYDGARVVYRPKTMTADQLLEGYHRSLKELYRLPSIVSRLWGNGSYKNFFYPMNFGFRHSVGKLWRAYQRGDLATSPAKLVPTAA